MRIPAYADLERPVVFRGARVKLRDAVLQADPNEGVHLRNGRVIPLQQVINAFDAWEKQANVRMARVPRRAAVPPPTQARLAASHQELTADLVQRRALAANGWRGVIDRPAGSRRTFSPLATRSPDAQPLLVAQPRLQTRRLTVPRAKAPTHPASEPYDDVWMRQWGDPSAVGAFVTVSAGNDFLSHDPSGTSAGCMAVAQVGAWLLGGSRELARAYAGAGATEQTIQGSARVYLLGSATPIWRQDGAFTLPKVERTYQTPEASAPIASIGPIQVNVALSGTGVALVQGAIQPHFLPGQNFGCDVILTPEVRATAMGGAKVVPMPGVQQVLEMLIGDASAGLTANLTLVDLSLPSRLGLNVRMNPANGDFVALDQRALTSFQAHLLTGKLVAWLELELGGVGGFIAGLLGADEVQHWEWDLHDFPGEHAQVDLVHVENTIPFVP